MWHGFRCWTPAYVSLVFAHFYVFSQFMDTYDFKRLRIRLHQLKRMLWQTQLLDHPKAFWFDFIFGLLNSKGQLNSEWIYEVIVSPKMPTQKSFKFLVGICLWPHKFILNVTDLYDTACKYQLLYLYHYNLRFVQLAFKSGLYGACKFNVRPKIFFV